jgi:hypothetical protein
MPERELETWLDSELGVGPVDFTEWMERTERLLPGPVKALASVKPGRIEWLWPGRIPLGMVTIFDGDPGLGKSTVLLDLAARGSIGGTTPTGEPLPTFDSLVLTSEDDPAITLRPRLDLAGGDPHRVHVLPNLTLPDEAEQLEAHITRLGALLVYLDPIVEYLGEQVKTASDHAVRRALKPLVEIARRQGCAIVAVRHLNKQGGLAAIYRGGGSIGFGGLARSVLAVGRDPDDAERFVLASVKINVARRPASLSYRLVAEGPYDPAKVEWLGESEHSAEALIGVEREEAGERSKVQQLADAMREIVRANHGEMLARDLYSALEADGWDLSSENMKTRAKRKAGIVMVSPAGIGESWKVRL